MNKALEILKNCRARGQKRGQMFDRYGVELLTLNKRIDFTGKGAHHFGVAWFCRFILDKQLMFA